MRFIARASLSLSILALGLACVPQALAGAGDLDRSFGAGGKTVRNLGGADFVADVATQRNRKVLALVDLERGGDNAVGVMRLRKDGRLDRDFGRKGLALVRLAGDERAGGIARAAGGKIVVSFTSDPSGADSAFGVARFRDSGRPDRTFDRDGVQTTGFGTGFSGATANDVALAGTRIVVVGRVWAPGEAALDFAVARFRESGRLDPSFAGDGRQTTDFPEGYDTAHGVDVDSDGRAVVVGFTDPPGVGGADPMAIARYDTAGELDGSFSDDGQLVSTAAPEGRDVVTLGDGRIAVAGTVSGDFLIARFAEDGAPDGSFSNDGVQTVDFADGSDTAVALTRTGSKLAVAGTVRTGRRGRDFGIARLNANGTLDRTFSQDGRRAVELASDEDSALAIATDRTGDLVVGGWAERRGQADSGLIRLDGARAGR